MFWGVAMLHVIALSFDSFCSRGLGSEAGRWAQGFPFRIDREVSALEAYSFFLFFSCPFN